MRRKNGDYKLGKEMAKERMGTANEGNNLRSKEWGQQIREEFRKEKMGIANKGNNLRKKEWELQKKEIISEAANSFFYLSSPFLSMNQIYKNNIYRHMTTGFDGPPLMYVSILAFWARNYNASLNSSNT